MGDVLFMWSLRFDVNNLMGFLIRSLSGEDVRLCYGFGWN
jgi:hypothetical protein